MLNRAFDTSRAFVGGELADKSPVDKLHRLQIPQKNIYTKERIQIESANVFGKFDFNYCNLLENIFRCFIIAICN